VKDSMKNSEEAIERVLAGLRDVEAPAGLERRVLNGLEERAAARALTGWRWFGPVWRGVPVGYAACGVALASVVLVVLAVPAIRRFGHVAAPSKMGVTPAMSSPAARSAIVAKRAEPGLHGRGVRLAKTADGARADLIGAGRSAAEPEDSVAISEMRAASFPAPPMPLTEQERLLLRIAHLNDPVEMAVLDPKLREMHDAQEKTEFQRFFARTPLKPSTEEGRSGPEETTTDQGVPMQTTEDSVSEQTTERPTEKQPPTDQFAPDQLAPNQFTMQQTAPRRMKTGENK